MRKLVKVFLPALLLAVGMTTFACGTKAEEEEVSIENATPINEDDLIGTWKGVEGEISTLTFSKSGSFKDDAGDISMSGTYFVDTVSNTVTVNESEYGMSFTYDCTLEGNVLTLQVNGGNPRKFCKIK